MLRIKKGFSEHLLQMALLFSLIGFDHLWPTSFDTGSSVPFAEVNVGSLDHWANDGYSYGFGPSTQIHPKIVDRYLDRHWLINELLSLGRYGDRYPSNIEAYLMNVDDNENNNENGNENSNENSQDDQHQQHNQQPSADNEVKTEPKEENNVEDVDQVFDTNIVDDVFMLEPEVSVFISLLSFFLLLFDG